MPGAVSNSVALTGRVIATIGLLSFCLSGCNPAAPPAGTTGGGTVAKSGDGGAVAKTGPAVDPKAVLPSPETIRDGSYTPLSRPLFIYVNKKSLATKPQLALFVHYYLNEGQAETGEVGYVPLADADVEAARAALKEAGVDKVDPAAEGTVVIDGSSTVYPLSLAIAKKIEEVTKKKVKVEVAKSGTGGGFKKFVVGETDINGASRPIDAKEVEAAAKSGVEYVGLKVAMDGISIVVSHDNDFISSITAEQLKKIWNKDSTVKKWNDIDPSFPDKEIHLYGADSDSGTFDFFTEVINGKSKVTRTDYTASGNDNDLVRGVQGDKYALGYIPFAYYLENAEELKLLGVVPPEAKKE